MGLHEQEQSIIEELKKLGEEPESHLKEPEQIIEEIQNEEAPDKEEEIDANDEEAEDEGKEPENKEEAEAEEVVDDEEKEEPEEQLTGAKFRHKLKAEKEARESLQRELNEMKIAQARMQGHQDASQKPQEPAEEIPDQEYEPDKYAIWKADKLEKKIEAMEAQQARINSERQWEQMENQHAKANPDYSEAKTFLMENESKKLRAQYPYASEAEIAGEVRRQELMLVGGAANAGMMPTEQIEFLAYRAGYRPGETTTTTLTPKRKPNIKNIKKNVKKNASLIGGSPAGDGGDERSAEQLNAMGMRDIDAFGRDKFEAALKKIHARG